MIEAIVVVSIVILLTSITVPGTVSALRTGRVNQAISMIDTANSDAQRFARATDSYGATEYYGVRITGGTPPHKIAVIYGVPGSANAVTGLEKNLSPSVLIYQGDSVLETSLEWYYQYGTGFPTEGSSPAGPTVPIGTSDSPVATSLSVRTLDGNANILFQIFEVAIFHRQEFE